MPTQADLDYLKQRLGFVPPRSLIDPTTQDPIPAPPGDDQTMPERGPAGIQEDAAAANSAAKAVSAGGLPPKTAPKAEVSSSFQRTQHLASPGYVPPQDVTGYMDYSDPKRPAHVGGVGETLNILRDEYLQSLADQKKGVEDQMANLNDLRRIPAQVNFQGGYNLAEALGGKRMPYKAPPSAEDYGLDLAKVENAIQSQRNKVSTSDIALLHNLFSGQTTNSTVIGGKSSVGVVPQNLHANPSGKTPYGEDAKEWLADTKALRDSIQDARRARSDIGEGDGPASNALKFSATALSARTRPPAAEYAGMTGGVDLFNRGEQALQKAATGQVLTAEDRRVFSTYVNNIDKLNSAKLQSTANARERSLGINRQNVDAAGIRGHAKRLMDMGGMGNDIPTGADPASTPGIMSPEEWLKAQPKGK